VQYSGGTPGSSEFPSAITKAIITAPHTVGVAVARVFGISVTGRFVRPGRLSVLAVIAMSETLERGDIFFLYRPKLDIESVHSVDDVQRFYMILKPDGKQVFRRIIIGRKRLPDPGEHERTWGFVDLVSSNPEEIEDELDPQQYETKTRGLRVEPPARPVGEGIYAIVCHDRHSHIAYALELPKEPGEAQRAFNIKKGASLIVTVKNPEASSPPQAGLPPSRKPAYPESVIRKFGDRRFVDLDPPGFLDYPGTELVLVGAREDFKSELGIDLRPRHQSIKSAALFTRLGMEKDVHPLEPLTTGEWK